MAEQLNRIELPQAAEVNFDVIPTDRLREMAAAGADVLNVIACSPIRAAISLASFCATSRRFRVGSLSSGGRLRHQNAFSGFFDHAHP